MIKLRPTVNMTVFVFFLALGLGNQVCGVPKNDKNELFEKLDLFSTVLSIIQKSYVEEIASKDLMYGALQGVLSSLDPHSQFLTPDMYQEVQIDTGGHFGGLGMEVMVQENSLVIVNPLPGTPSAHAGLQSGDKIVKINERLIETPIILDDIIKTLRGPIGSKVNITVFRTNTQQYFTVELTREDIKIDSVTHTQVLPETNIGYIKILRFQEKTSEEFKEALKKLQTRNIQGLILDLRNNPGGLMEEGINVAGMIVGGKQLIVYTKGRLPEQNVRKFSPDHLTPLNLPLAILLNYGSASASEIVSGAIQDLKKGTIIGEKSFGKASVQSIIPLKDGSALRLTTASYFTPKDRMIHKKGIEPDIKVSQTEEDLNTIQQKHQAYREGNTKALDELYIDTQIKTAIQVLNGTYKPTSSDSPSEQQQKE